MCSCCDLYRSDNTITPIQFAASGNHSEIVKLLIDNGASISRKEPVPVVTPGPLSLAQLCIRALNQFYSAPKDSSSNTNPSAIPPIDALPSLLPVELLNRVTGWSKQQRAKESLLSTPEPNLKIESCQQPQEEKPPMPEATTTDGKLKVDSKQEEAKETEEEEHQQQKEDEEEPPMGLKGFAPPGTVTIPYSILGNWNTRQPLMGYLEHTRLESYLSEAEFNQVMGVDRQSFASWAKWKQVNKKKDTKLF